jgi:predicted metal-dependent hydrolase
MTAAPEVEITVRRPEIDFADVDPIWTPAHPELAYRLNGGSLTLPYLEPYLIRVMRRARQELGDRHPALVRDIDLFNAQEAHHYKLHSRYNAMLRERYTGIEALEAEIEADFARMLNEESLPFNLGYAAGFETTGLVMARLFFEASGPSLEGADPRVRSLWGWHLAEEYEHRCVAFDVFRAYGGSWPQRIRMFAYQYRHLNGFGRRAARHMRAQDERAGRISSEGSRTPDQNKIERRQARFAALRTVAALLPGHDPRRQGPLVPAERFLGELEWS